MCKYGYSFHPDFPLLKDSLSRLYRFLVVKMELNCGISHFDIGKLWITSIIIWKTRGWGFRRQLAKRRMSGKEWGFSYDILREKKIKLEERQPRPQNHPSGNSNKIYTWHHGHSQYFISLGSHRALRSERWVWGSDKHPKDFDHQPFS